MCWASHTQPFHLLLPQISYMSPFPFHLPLPLPQFHSLSGKLFLYLNRKSLPFSPPNLSINLHLDPHNLPSWLLPWIKYSWLHQRPALPIVPILHLLRLLKSLPLQITPFCEQYPFLFSTQSSFPIKKWQILSWLSPSIFHSFICLHSNTNFQVSYSSILSLTHSN